MTSRPTVWSDDDDVSATFDQPVATGERRSTMRRHRAALACHSVRPPCVFRPHTIIDKGNLLVYSVVHSMPGVTGKHLPATAVRKNSGLATIQSLEEGVCWRNLYRLLPLMPPASKDVDYCLQPQRLCKLRPRSHFKMLLSL
jgi:hypothetical protein